jgi:hypothetical protein
MAFTVLAAGPEPGEFSESGKPNDHSDANIHTVYYY